MRLKTKTGKEVQKCFIILSKWVNEKNVPIKMGNPKRKNNFNEIIFDATVVAR